MTIPQIVTNLREAAQHCLNDADLLEQSFKAVTGTSVVKLPKNVVGIRGGNGRSIAAKKRWAAQKAQQAS